MSGLITRTAFAPLADTAARTVPSSAFRPTNRCAASASQLASTIPGETRICSSGGNGPLLIRGLLSAALSPPSSPPGGGSLDATGAQAATDNSVSNEIGRCDMAVLLMGRAQYAHPDENCVK